MTKEIMTMRQMINGDGQTQIASPLDFDLTDIIKLSNAIPKDNNIDLNNAEVLATRLLKGSDLCSELASIAYVFVEKAATERKKAYSTAALTKASAAGIKTDKSRAWFAEMDEDYIAACNKYTEAQAFLRFITSKYETFVKGHYLIKKMLDRGYQHENAASWNGRAEEIVDGIKPLEEGNEDGGEEVENNNWWA